MSDTDESKNEGPKSRLPYEKPELKRHEVDPLDTMSVGSCKTAEGSNGFSIGTCKTGGSFNGPCVQIGS